MRALVVLVVTGCSAHPAAGPRVLANTAPPATAPSPTHSVWVGRYACAEGIAAVRLTIDRDGEAATGTFESGPLAENPSVAKSSFRMNGMVKAVGGELMISLAPSDQIDSPERDHLVDFDAITEGNGTVMHAKISTRGCTELDVKRVE